MVRGEVARLSNQRTAAAGPAGNPGPGGSIAKLAMAELNKDVYDVCMHAPGGRRPDRLRLHVPPAERSAARRHTGLGAQAFLRVRANSIEGGTSEIMRNILGEQVLGLPGEPRVDNDLPWSQVPRS